MCLISESDLIQTALFSANDLYGNVKNVSLQCQSSDLAIESVVMVFISSVEVNKVDVCYKVLPYSLDLKRRCEGRGCSGVYVHGHRGCGGNKNILSHGLYVCYTCKGSKATNLAPKRALFGPITTRQGLSSIDAEGKDWSSLSTQYSTVKNDEQQVSTPRKCETTVP